MSEKFYNYYYFDEKNDDFANNGIESKPTPKNYEYLPKNILFRIFKPIVYFFILVLVYVILFFYRVPIKNSKVLKNRKDKKKGYFVYGNHTGWLIDAISGPAGSGFSRQTYTIVSSDTICIKGIRTLVRLVGALPVPSSTGTYMKFVSAVDKLYEKGSAIVVYPEAHIWPKYNEIRDFDAVSFKYPAKLNAPCFTKTTVYKKKNNGKTKPIVYYDGPFYPNTDLPLKDRELDLKDKIRNQLIKRALTEDSSIDYRYTYTKVNSKEEVKTEIIKK